MTDASTPVAGWYPDPADPTRYRRYWDGNEWTVRQLAPQAPALAGYPPPQPEQVLLRWRWRPVRRGFEVLSRVIGIGLVLAALTSVGQLALHVWGVSMIDDAVAAGDVDRLESYDGADAAGFGVYATLVTVTGICWMVWQYRLARSVRSNGLNRTPPWHAWSWVIPIGVFWMPFQNVRSLWRELAPARTRPMIGWWWAAIISSAIVARITAAGADDIQTVDGVRSLIAADAVSDVLSILAAVLAIRLLRALTRAGLASSAITPAASPAA